MKAPSMVLSDALVRVRKLATDASAALAAGLLCALLPVSCGGSSMPKAGGTAALVHLADQLASASVTSAPAPASARAERTWNFREPQPDWHPVAAPPGRPGLAPVEVEQLEDGVRLSLLPSPQGRMLVGGIVIEHDEPLAACAGILVRARSHSRLAGIGAACNIENPDSIPGGFDFFGGEPGTAPVFNDGSVQTYSLELPASKCGDSLHSLALFASAPKPASFELLSITMVPRGSEFLEDSGVRPVDRDSITRRTLFAHTPAKLAWKVAVGAGGRLDLGLSCLEGEAVTYRVSVSMPGSDHGESKTLLEQKIDDFGKWRQVALDLAPWAGREIEVALEAASDRPGAVALWGAPILSGGRADTRPPRRPNVLFYVIDGGGADLMSVYGYNRRTTPFLERLAQEGVVFERAFSNSTWTQASTASFMTSLHHSVLGGLRRGIHSTPVPAKAVTMAEHMRRGGYETAVLTSNPNAARVIGLERGVDFLRDGETEHHSTSSAELHEAFWSFRAAYPGHPFWVHFQTTDVHEPNEPPAPFAGLFVTPQDRAQLREWDRRLFQAAGELFGTTSIAAFYDAALEKAGIDRRAYFNIRRGLYDETMAFQDRELERFVARLKAEGEWENTILIVAADHGHPAGTFARFGRGLIEPQPEPWQGALFDSYSTRVPLIFVWPGRIAGGRRIEQPVSMIDVLPTILELADLPAPEILQGRSLAGALFGRELEPRPVIFDEFRVDEATGEMVGNLEMIDGRWGASLEIGPLPAGSDPTRGRHPVPAGGRWGAVHPFFPDAPRLLLYDLWNDPFAVRAINDEHADLVEHYRKALLEQWKLQRALAQSFGEAADQPLTSDVLEQLRTLGYVR
jgi:arylsulfatase A-like enzyme